MSAARGPSCKRVCTSKASISALNLALHGPVADAQVVRYRHYRAATGQQLQQLTLPLTEASTDPAPRHT